MTNLEAVEERRASLSDEPVQSEILNEELPVMEKLTVNPSIVTRSKSASGLTDEQILKSPATKVRTYKRNVKVHRSKSRQDANQNNVIESNPLKELKNVQIVSKNTRSAVKKDNKCINKSKEFSPSHKLTEYFSELRVDKEDKQEECQTNEENTVSPAKQTNSLLETPKKKTLTQKSKSNIELTNHKVTEYFQARRSKRKYVKSLIYEQQRDLENKIICEVEDGLEVKEFEEKGRGVVTTRDFHKGEFVVEYIGELIDGVAAKQREIKYSKKKNVGCYMYYFKHKDIQYCIDATEESGKLGRLINHSRKGNLVSRVIEVHSTPHLVLFAKTNIPVGTEVLYDYGDRSQESVKHHPWLNL